MLEDGGQFFRIAILLPLLNFKIQCYFHYDTTKKVINFRGYSLIHINIMINLKSIRSIYHL